MSLRKVDSFIDSLRTIVSLDGMSKFKQNTYNLMSSFNGWMRRVAHDSQKSLVKRLNKRRSWRRGSRSSVKMRPNKCNCKKCKRRINRTIIQPDLLANMAYELRVSQEKPLKIEDLTVKDGEEPKRNNEEIVSVIEKPSHVRNTQEHQHDLNPQFDRHHQHQHHHQDCRSLPKINIKPVQRQQSDCVELAWWTNTNHRVYLPPLIHVLPTKSNLSECSSISALCNDSPPISDCLSSHECTSSDDSDYKSCRDVMFSHYHTNSKSVAKIPLDVGLSNKKNSVGRSVSMPPGQKPGELQGLQMAAKRKSEKKRPVRLTSHTTDSFSNCIKCSRIISYNCKKMT